MNNKFRLPKDIDENGYFVYETTSAEQNLRHFKNVNSSLMQDALDVWAELWEEFQDRVTCGIAVLPEAKKGFIPSCGWPEFLEKMWLLRHYMDFAKSLSDPD